MHENERTTDYEALPDKVVVHGSYNNGYSYGYHLIPNPFYIPGLSQKTDKANYLKTYRKFSLAENTKAALLSWWVPLTIAMITMSLGIYEGTLGDSAPYLISTSTLIGTLLLVTHIVHTCLTTRSYAQLRDATPVSHFA